MSDRDINMFDAYMYLRTGLWTDHDVCTSAEGHPSTQAGALTKHIQSSNCSSVVVALWDQAQYRIVPDIPPLLLSFYVPGYHNRLCNPLTTYVLEIEQDQVGVSEV